MEVDIPRQAIEASNDAPNKASATSLLEAYDTCVLPFIERIANENAVCKFEAMKKQHIYVVSFGFHTQ